MAQIILDSANNLIQGDFDTATLSQRTRMQTSTVNATTGVYVVPNGSATSASVQVSNAADPTNASKVVVATNGSTDTQIVSGANGSGTYLPLSFYTNNDIRFQMGTAGELNVRTAPGTVSSGTSGQFLTSGGPGAGVSWTSIPAGGQLQTELFTGPGTWTKPSSATQVRVTVIGGGGGGGGVLTTGSGGIGGYGGIAYVTNVPVSGPVSITVGSGGAGAVSPSNTPGGTGGTSSFGPAISCTGGAGATGGSGGAAGSPGSATISLGTSLKSGNLNGLTYLGGVAGGISSNPNPGAGPSAVAYSTTSSLMSGARGSGGGPGLPGAGGCGGAVLVEFVG